LIQALTTADGGRLELLLGDLTAVPPEHSVDALVVSAFPNDYTPTRSSLIGALAQAGLSVKDLAADKEEDLREFFNCWLSRELRPEPQLPYRRVLCFEPSATVSPIEKIADVFRALEPFAHAPPYIKSIAMPLLTTGDRGGDVDAIAAALVSAAARRLAEGHPIRTIKIVVRSEGHAEIVSRLLSAFAHMVRSQGDELQFYSNVPLVSDREPYDVFISYARHNVESARIIDASLKAEGIRAFIDEMEIDLGAAWQQAIFDALENCRCVVALYSPDFLRSKVCQDEFAIAMILRRQRDEGFLAPLLLEDVSLPAYMQIVNYADCRVSEPAKLRANAVRIASRLKA
jgi:hypothetical protein